MGTNQNRSRGNSEWAFLIGWLVNFIAFSTICNNCTHFWLHHINWFTFSVVFLVNMPWIVRKTHFFLTHTKTSDETVPNDKNNNSSTSSSSLSSWWHSSPKYPNKPPLSYLVEIVVWLFFIPPSTANSTLTWVQMYLYFLKSHPPQIIRNTVLNKRNAVLLFWIQFDSFRVWQCVALPLVDILPLKTYVSSLFIFDFAFIFSLIS